MLHGYCIFCLPIVINIYENKFYVAVCALHSTDEAGSVVTETYDLDDVIHCIMM